MTVFLAFAVITILRDIFRNQQIGFDHLLGAFSGFCWRASPGEIFMCSPKCFIPARSTWTSGLLYNCKQEQARRFLFNYFSFMTLTTLGYGDVTPVSPSAVI